MQRSKLFFRAMNYALTPLPLRAHLLRESIALPVGLKRIVNVIHCFTITCLMSLVLFPVFIRTFDVTLFFVFIVECVAILAASLTHLLATGLFHMKQWALTAFILVSSLLISLFVYRLFFSYAASDFFAPIFNIALLVTGIVYLIRPSVRYRFSR